MARPSLTYRLYGLAVSSDVTLPGPVLPEDYPVDVDVRHGEPRSILYERPSETVIAEFVQDGWARYSFCVTNTGVTARFFGLCDFDISADLKTVTCHLDPGGQSDLVPILVAGTVLALVLSLHGDLVLHASAVTVEGGVLAFAGHSGSGKSTMAGLLCSRGARLVTDDVLRVVDLSTHPACVGGASELRLRRSAEALLAVLAGDVRTTADARTAVRPPAADQVPRRLVAVVTPVPDREAERVTAERLSAHAAAAWLVRNTRIDGLQSSEHLKRAFLQTAQLASAVPVIRMTVPWGPPFREDLVDQLLTELGLTTTT